MISKAVALFHNSNRNILISLILSFSTLSTFYWTEIITKMFRMNKMSSLHISLRKKRKTTFSEQNVWRTRMENCLCFNFCKMKVEIKKKLIKLPLASKIDVKPCNLLYSYTLLEIWRSKRNWKYFKIYQILWLFAALIWFNDPLMFFPYLKGG